jgi:hypothetical protein
VGTGAGPRGRDNQSRQLPVFANKAVSQMVYRYWVWGASNQSTRTVSVAQGTLGSLSLINSGIFNMARLFSKPRQILL